MADLTRREWHKLALSGLAMAALPSNLFAKTKMINSRFKGVLIGAQSYSFRTLPTDAMIQAMADVGLGSCELWQGGHVDPREFPDSKLPKREALRQWRLTKGVDEC